MKNKKISATRKRITRRTFVKGAAAGTALAALCPLSNLFTNDFQEINSWPADASKFRFHMIGQAHIDPVWLWPWSEGIAVVHSTFRSALDRMNETPDFTFTASSAQFYQWVAENDPAMLREIKNRVAEGRWNIVGGWWVEPDVNIPSGESMVRQGLYGQETMKRLLGRRATVAFNPDSFGHCSTLPQILKLQGMEDYIFMRPGIKEKTLPADLFWWEGVDGTRILTYRIPISYTDNGSVRRRIEQILTQFKDQPVKSFMAYYGAGDHGGGATKENISSIAELKSDKDAPAIFFSTPDNYFDEIRKYNNINLPVVKDDLQHHAAGCYTAESEIKKGNRTSEAALVTAEKIAAIGSSVWGAKYPGAEFASAWKRVLFLQFHDSLAGTSLPEHSRTAREGFGYATDIARYAMYMSLQKLEWQVGTEDPASQYLLVFNPHAWEVSGNIEYDFNWDIHNPSRVEDGNGNPLFHQWTPGSTETGSRQRLVINTIIPAFGYRQIRLLKGDTLPVSVAATADGNILENEYLRVQISSSGTIGIFDKEYNREVFKNKDSGCRALIINDQSDTWSHDIKTFSDEIGTFRNAGIKVLENGPLRATIRAMTIYGNSTLTIDWTLYSGSRNLSANVTLDWHEHLKMLKFSFPVDVESPEATFETPYGYIVRAANGNEDPGQRWIDVSGKSKGNMFGLTVINDAKYGYSVSESDMRISIARSAVYAHHNPRVLDIKSEHLWMDQGIQTFRMLLIPHEDTWKKSNIARLAEEFIAPPLTIFQGIHGGSMPLTASFLAIDDPNIIVSAIKMSEDDNDVIIRCIESSGSAITSELDLRFAGRKWKGNFRPFEIKTLRMNQNSGDIKEVNLLEE